MLALQDDDQSDSSYSSPGYGFSSPRHESATKQNLWFLLDDLRRRLETGNVDTELPQKIAATLADLSKSNRNEQNSAFIKKCRAVCLAAIKYYHHQDFNKYFENLLDLSDNLGVLLESLL